MNIENFREFCLKLPHSYECTPFDETTVVFKVGNTVTSKIFALISLDKQYVMLKCDPDQALELREQYATIEPAYHMNKRHWNGIIHLETLTNQLMMQMIEDSYQLVFNSLPKYMQAELR